MDLDTIRVFTISKLDSVRKHRAKFRDQERETPREYLERESHFLWGRRYLMRVVEVDEVPRVELEHRTMTLRVRPGTDESKRQEIVEGWYRGQVRATAAPVIKKWEQRLGVQVERFFVRSMKTRWGSCNPATRSIRFNTDLAKKPKIAWSISSSMTWPTCWIPRTTRASSLSWTGSCRSGGSTGSNSTVCR